MTLSGNDITILQPDTKILSDLIIELNIALRNSRAYPKGHPVVATSLLKAVNIYRQLLQQIDEVVISVAHDSLLCNGTTLDKNNQVFRNFARTLFERGIAALIMRQGLTPDELSSFTGILAFKRDEIARNGGIEAVWANAKIESIAISPVRYDIFSTSEEITVSVQEHPPEKLWERFAQIFSQAGMDNDPVIESGFDPVVLASALNTSYGTSQFNIGNRDECVGAITEIIQQLDNPQQSSPINENAYQRLALFVSNLNPELRRQFLATSFDSCTPDTSHGVEKLMSVMSTGAVIDTLHDVNTNKMKVPPVILDLLQKLGSHAAPDDRINDELSDFSQDELGDKMKTLFREQASEEFVPEVYQKKLDQLISLDKVPSLETTETAILKETLAPQLIEERISEIIIHLITTDLDMGDNDSLMSNLGDMCTYFLETGDYDQVLKIISKSRGSGTTTAFNDKICEHLSKRESLDEVLNGLHVWGKARYDQIRQIIVLIGDVFIEPLLDALAEEENLSLRRFLMDILLEFGPGARHAIIARLSDHRWYVLRNLVIMLRSMNDPTVLEFLRPLLHHQNQRVKQEVIRTFLDFHDPAIERQIVQELSSSDRNLQLAAVHLADKCRSSEVVNSLVAILSRSGFSSSDCEIKSAVIHTLGEIGRAEALPELARILTSRSLFHSRQLTKLKLEIIHSLEHYQMQAARKLLERLEKGNDELARQASITLRAMANKHD